MRRFLVLEVALILALNSWGRGDATYGVADIQIGAPAAIVSDAGASGGRCVELGSPTGGRIDAPNPAAPQATLTFHLDVPGRIAVSVRVLAPNSGADSLYFALDDAQPAMVPLPASPEWGSSQLASTTLAEGVHTLRFYTREPGVRIDTVQVSEGNLARSVVEKYPAPPIVPPVGVHPRILMRAEHIATIKARRTQGENAEAWAIVQKQAADESLSGKLPAEKTGPLGNYDAKVLHAIRSKAFVYALDDDEERGREAVAMMMDFLRTVRFGNAFDITRYIGRSIYVGALVYDWCYPLMDDAQRKEMIRCFETMAEGMEIGYPPRGSAVTGHSGEAQFLQNLLSAAVAVYDEYPDMYRMAGGRFFAEFIEPRDFAYVSGRHHQGDSYGPFRFQWEMFPAWLFRRMADVDVYGSAMRDVPYSWLYLRRPDGQMLCDGDSFNRGDYWRFPEGFALVSAYYRDPILKSELMRQTGGRVFLGSRDFSIDPELFLLTNDPTLPVRSTEGLPLTRFRGGPTPSMQCRTGWDLGYGSPAVVADFKGAGYQFNNHHHLDAGSFQIYYKGALANDPGAYVKYGSEYDFGYNKRSICHNMMLVYDPDEKMIRGINDGGMRSPSDWQAPATLEILKTRGYKVGSVPAHAFGPNPDVPLYSYMRVNLDKAYTQKVRAYTRSFCFLNLDNAKRPAAVIVLDDMTTARGDLKKFWLLHALEKPRISPGRIDVRRTENAYNGRLSISTLLPEKPAVRLVEDKDRTVEVFGKTLAIEGDQTETGGWRIEISPSVPSEHDEMLHVMQVMDAEGVEPLEVRKLEHEGLIGVSLGDRTVWFVRGPEPLKRMVEIDVPAAGQALVAGLRPGHWVLETPGGGARSVHEVGPGDGTLFFLAKKAGPYRLSPFAQPDTIPAPDLTAMKPEVRASRAAVLLAGKTLSFDKPFAREGGTALIPLCKTLALAGIRAKLEGDTLTAENCGQTLTVRAGEAAYRLGGHSFAMSAWARMAEDDLLAPPDPAAVLARCRFVDSVLLGEVRFYMPPTAAQPSYWIESVSVDGPPSRHPAMEAIDGNPDTMWSCQADEARLVLDLGEAVAVARVSVQWYHGAQRQAFFGIEVSRDGKGWQEVWNGKSSGKAADAEVYTFDKRPARYVRLVCRGNSVNKWNSIGEVQILKD